MAAMTRGRVAGSQRGGRKWASAVGAIGGTVAYRQRGSVVWWEGPAMVGIHAGWTSMSGGQVVAIIGMARARRS
jgi:hypothetical protein